MSWTTDRVELLTKLWKEGKTAKEIAETLGDGITRNAVIGKAHRLNLSGRESPIQKGAKKSVAASKAKLAGAKIAGAKKSGTQKISANKADSGKISGKKAAKIISPQGAANANIAADQDLQANSSKLHAKKSSAVPLPANKNLKTASGVAKSSSKGGVSLHDLKDRMCRWPHGDPQESDFHFCGAPSVPGMPYCEEHAKIAYQLNKKVKALTPESFEPAQKDEDIESEQIA